MYITKTINEILEGEIILNDDIGVDFSSKKMFIGAEFKSKKYSCEATFQEVLESYTPAQKQALSQFFKKAIALALNNEINPDTEIVANDIILKNEIE